MNQTNLYNITVPALIRGLKNAQQMLDIAQKLAESKADQWHPVETRITAILNERLIFDQFPLIKQIQVMCDNAKGAVCRLAEIEIPKFEDNEQNILELKARIEKTLLLIESIKPEQIEGKEDIKISLPWFQNQYFTGIEYVNQFLLPNFYFHLSTAYSILRMNGADIGKKDYLGQLPLKNN